MLGQPLDGRLLVQLEQRCWRLSTGLDAVHNQCSALQIDRRIALVWRKSFPRTSAIDALTRGIMESGLAGVNYLKVEYNSNFPYPELA